MSDPLAPLAEFTPYEVVDSGRSVEDVFAQVNEAVWYGYGPDYRVGGPGKIVAGPEFDFVALLRDLTALPQVRFVAHHEFLAQPCGGDEVRIALRHDIDSDIVAAAHQAQIEADFGVVANWVVLHTAPYYGAVDDAGRFVRNDSMIEVYRRFHELGHEVSIHSDPLGLYQFHGIDGAQGFTAELEWLRSNGIEIRGSTAHNHRPTYGAENFEIFAGYVAPAPNAQPADASWVTHKGKHAPLRVLDERALGLEYEGNQVFWREDLAIEYGSARFSNLWFWADHRRRRNAEPTILDREFLDQRRMVEQIANLPGGSNLVLVVHPEYFGARTGVDQAPVRALDRAETTSEGSFGWTTWQPHSVVATADATGDDQTRQAVNVANEWGMLDLPIADRPEAERRIVFLGGTNVDGAAVAVPSQFPARIGLLGVDRLSQTVDLVKLAHPDMAIDRLWGWLAPLLKHGENTSAANALDVNTAGPAPDTVVIGVSAVPCFGPDSWEGEGAYLAVGDDGAVEERSWLSGETVTPQDATAKWVDSLACLRWVIERLWASEIRTVLLVEHDGGVGPAAWSTDARRRSLQSLAVSTGALLVDPTSRIAAEADRLGEPLGADGIWHATAHRVVSEELFAALFPQATPSEFTSNYERRRDALAGATDLLPASSALGVPTQSAMNEAHERREALGIRTYPTPFESAIAIVGDVDGSSTPFYRNYMGRIVGELGLDHGDSIHLVGYHQRYSRGRRGLATNIRAILSYDLRRDNAAIGQGESWFAHLLAEYHRGNIDHLHGLYAWGARTLPLTITEGASGKTRLASPFEGSAPSEGPREPFAYNAEHFPLVTVVIETSSPTVPPHVVPRYAPPPPDDADVPNVKQRRPDVLALAATRVAGGRTLATYSAPLELLAPVDPSGANGVIPQVELLGVEVDLDPATVYSAALHNTDPSGVVQALGELGRRFNVGFDLLTAHGRYHFYTAEAMEPQMAALEKVRDDRGREKPHALFGRPAEGGAASVALADDPTSAAQVFPGLIDEGIRHLTPCGLISRREAHFDPFDVTYPTIDRAGRGISFLRRTQPDCAWEPTEEQHGRYSRLSTFENRLRHVLDQLDDGRVGVYPIYTHLGQTSDLNEPPDPWFRDGVLEDLAARYYGMSEPDELRPWVTRASMLANYTTLLQALPDLVSRGRDRVDIARQLDPLTGHHVPDTHHSLYGVSFEADNTRRMTVSFDGQPIEDLVRWHDRGEVTVVPCAISWPLVLDDDPVKVATHDGDLGEVVADGEWSWHRGTGARGPELDDPAAYGRLAVPEGATSARIHIELDGLVPAGAQIAGAKIRKGHGAERVTLRFHTEGGATYELQDMSAQSDVGSPTEGTGTFGVVLRSGAWADLRAPLWGFSWSGPMPEYRTIRSVELVVTGEPGATVEVADVFLGRPRSAAPHRHSTGPRLGGDAVGRSSVHLRRLGDVTGLTCSVEPDGLWSSPPVEPGAWLVETDGAHQTVVQVRSDRYDLRVAPDPDFYNR